MWIVVDRTPNTCELFFVSVVCLGVGEWLPGWVGVLFACGLLTGQNRTPSAAWGEIDTQKLYCFTILLFCVATYARTCLYKV